MNWDATTGSDDGIILSIVLLSYNQIEYVEEAVASIAGQRMPEGRIEVIVADDHSTDGTQELIERVWKPIDGVELVVLRGSRNLGVTRNYERAFSHCRGRYVAILEGDDYWSCNTKLRRQVEILETYHHFSACGHNYLVNETAKSSFTPRISPESAVKYMTSEALVSDNLPGNFSTMMYRRSALEALPKQLYTLKAYDWILNICVARLGPIAVLPDIMSVYRVHDKGSWSGLTATTKLREQIDCLTDYDELTGRVFTDSFRLIRQRVDAELLCMTQDQLNVPAAPERETSEVRRVKVLYSVQLANVLRAVLPPVLVKAVPFFAPPALISAIKWVARSIDRIGSTR